MGEKLFSIFATKNRLLVIYSGKMLFYTFYVELFNENKVAGTQSAQKLTYTVSTVPDIPPGKVTIIGTDPQRYRPVKLPA